MKLAEFSVKNSLFVNLISIFMLVAGIFAMFNLRRDAFPQVSFDQVTVQTMYAGAPAEDVEKLITIPIEKELKSVSGLKEINSSSEEGLSLISLTIEPEERDKKKVVDDIRRAVDLVSDLPKEVEDPLVLEVSTKDMPILEIFLSGLRPEGELRQMAEGLEDQILDVDGVASVRRFGWRDRQFWVELDPLKLDRLHVSLNEVMEALRLRNITTPGGQIRTPDMEFNVRTTAEFMTPQEVEEVVIRSNDAGNFLKVKDIGQVIDTFEDETRVAKVNGERAVAMVVVKREQADAIKVTDQVKRIVDGFKREMPADIKVGVANDFSYYIKRRLGVLQSNGIQGFILVLLILFAFMEPVPAVATALGIPFAFLSTFAFMLITGMTINLVTMLGMIIVVGMIVDDGIVTSENIYRYIEMGMPLREAVVKGASEVFSPIVGSIVTTWAAFFPLLFMTDLIGRFIHSIPIVVIVALAASLVESFLVLPTHIADWSKHFTKGPLAHTTPRREKPWIKKLVYYYSKVLSFSIQHRYRVVLGLTLAFVGAVLLAVFHLKIILFTGEGVEEFYIRAEAPKGTPLKKMEDLITPVERLVETIPKTELDTYRTYLGSIEEEGGFDPRARRGTHLGQVTVFLTPMQIRKRSPERIMDALRPELSKIPGFEKLYFFKPKEGPPVGRPIAVSVRGENFDTLQEISQKFLNFLQEIPGVSDVNLNYEYGKKQLKVVINEEKARQYDLSIAQIASTVRSAIQGGLATAIKPLKADKEIDVLVRFPESARDDLKVFEKIFVSNQKGNLVPILSVARIEEISGAYQIHHIDGKRAIVVSGEVDNKRATAFSVNRDLQKEIGQIRQQYPGYAVRLLGEYEEQQRTFRNILMSFTLVLFFIFVILAREFNSLLQPVLIMITIPFGFMGVVYTFFLHGRPLSFFALLGLVGLSGVVVNGAIVLVDFINRLRRQGMALRDSLMEAGKVRLRPILMTSSTTIGGLVSVAYGIGGGDPFLKPMALAIMWGLAFSTTLTLIALPAIYAIFDDFAEKVFHKHLVNLNEE